MKAHCSRSCPPARSTWAARRQLKSSLFITSRFVSRLRFPCTKCRRASSSSTASARTRSCAQQPWSGDDYPVVNVSWDEARSYAEWLSSVTHYHYGLPTEAQWEYAARAGRTGLFPSGDALSPTDAQFSIREKQSAAARRAQKFNANAFRIVHTVGNVREWVEDGWSQNFTNAPNDGSAVKFTQAAQRVARGGSYTDGAARLRLSMREALSPGTRDMTTGFRIVRVLP